MKSLRELLAQVTLFARIQTSFADHIEDAEKRLDKLGERLGQLEQLHDNTRTRTIQVEQTLGDHLKP